MVFIEDRVLEILEKLPNEDSWLDYKIIPYNKKSKADFIKDVIAMLNAEDAIGREKFIIIGVEDKNRQAIGLKEEWPDNSTWNPWLDNIYPRPIIRTGWVMYQEKKFGYINISANNRDFVYEVANTVIPEDCRPGRIEKSAVFKGQAFTRQGSCNTVLSREGRQKLCNKISLHRNLEIKLDFNELQYTFAAALVGCWNEKYEGDLLAISTIAGENVQNFLEKQRFFCVNNPDVFTFSDGLWTCQNHKELLLETAKYLDDKKIKRFFEESIKVLQDFDPKYTLASNQRFSADLILHNKKKKFSNSLLYGIAEAVSIIGNNQDKFITCSASTIQRCCKRLLQQVFSTKDWKVYATIADCLEFLGESDPDEFLNQIENLLKKDDQAFLKFLNEKDTAVTSVQYGYQLESILKVIAQKEKYFSRVMIILFRLSEIDERFLKSMVVLVLPWYPQTNARAEIREGVFNSLIRKNEDLSWKVLMKLIPNASQFTDPVETPKFMETGFQPYEKIPDDWYEVSKEYLKKACSIIHSKTERILDLLHILGNFAVTESELLIKACEENVQGLSFQDKIKIWNEIRDMQNKSRKYPNSRYALDERLIKDLEIFADILFPNSEDAENIRLFCGEQYTLINNVDETFDEQVQKLQEKQISIIQSKYKNYSFRQFLSFLQMIENKFLAGFCFTKFATVSDILDLFAYEENLLPDQFIQGIIYSLDFKVFSDVIKKCGYSDERKAVLLSYRSLDDDDIYIASTLQSEKALKIYWSNVSSSVKEPLNSIETIVSYFNKYSRSHESLQVLNIAIDNKINIPTKLVLDTLQTYTGEYIQDTMVRFYAQNLIKWLQKQQLNMEQMVPIEWKYLQLLNDPDHSSLPINLWNRLSTQPEFYIYILKLAYKNNKGEYLLDIPETKRGSMAELAFELLYGWKSIPGKNSNSDFDSKLFNDWVRKSFKLAKESGLFEVARQYIGKICFYAPPDKDGYFLDKSVARFMEQDSCDDIRKAFCIEALNSIGVHYYGGSFMLKQEKLYQERAVASDVKGYPHIAEMLRQLANEFHREAEFEKRRSSNKSL